MRLIVLSSVVSPQSIIAPNRKQLPIHIHLHFLQTVPPVSFLFLNVVVQQFTQKCNRISSMSIEETFVTGRHATGLMNHWEIVPNNPIFIKPFLLDGTQTVANDKNIRGRKIVPQSMNN